MNSRIHILEELRELNSSLPTYVNEPVFTVPDGYFDGFAASVLAKIKAMDAASVNEELSTLSPLLAAIPRTMPYTLPENYFQDQVADLPALIDEEVIPSVLSEHHRQMPYETPAGYFNTLPEAILARVERPKAKVVPMRTRGWMRVAAAAMIVGVIAISGFFYFSGRSNNALDPASSSEEWVAKQLKGVSTDALEDFIQTTDISPDGSSTAKGRASEVRSMLTDVSDRELENFLEQVPTDDEELSVIN
jgi:hypothetical protein